MLIRVILESAQSYYLRGTFHKVIAAIDGCPLIALGKSTENLWEGFPIPDAMNNIPDSGEEAQISPLTGLRKKLTPAFMDHLEGSRLQ